MAPIHDIYYLSSITVLDALFQAIVSEDFNYAQTLKASQVTAIQVLHTSFREEVKKLRVVYGEERPDLSSDLIEAYRERGILSRP
jgi:TRAP-type C4-dicarboxylate transport system substrate-binding protein